MSILTIHRKTVILAAVAVASILIMAALQYRAVNDYRSTGEIRVLVSDIESNMLTLRRNEKDFLVRKDLQYSQKFMDNYRVTLRNVQGLRSDLHEIDIENRGVNRLIEILEIYKNKFLALVELQKKIGFNHQDGLYGRLRESIHKVEKLLATYQQDKLSKDMLMLRRHEKDFMLRHDIAYMKHFDEDMAVMRANLSKTYLYPQVKNEITTALTAYERDVKALVSTTQQMGLTSDEGVHGEMKTSIHQSDEILNELRKSTLSLEGDAGSDMIKQLIAFAGIVLVLILSVSWIS